MLNSHSFLINMGAELFPLDWMYAVQFAEVTAMFFTHSQMSVCFCYLPNP